jgi:hypothetical protein
MNGHSVGLAIAWWVVVVLLFFPSVLLARLWLSQAARSGATALERTTVIIATLSQALMILALVSTSVFDQDYVLGGSYSDRRFAAIFTNLFVMLLLAVVVMIRGRSLRWRLAFPCLWLCGSWLYIAVISSVV